MRVYVLVKNEVYDFEGFAHTPEVFESKSDAIKALKELRETVKEELPEYDGEDEWDENGQNESFSIYPDGEWGKGHYDAYIKEVTVKPHVPSYILTENGTVIGRSGNKSYLNSKMGDLWGKRLDEEKGKNPEVDRFFYVGESAGIGDIVTWRISEEDAV